MDSDGSVCSPGVLSGHAPDLPGPLLALLQPHEEPGHTLELGKVPHHQERQAIHALRPDHGPQGHQERYNVPFAAAGVVRTFEWAASLS